MGNDLRSLTLLVRTTETLGSAADAVNLHHLVDFLLVLIEVLVEFRLIVFNVREVLLYFLGIAFSLEGLCIELLDPVRVLYQRAVPLCDRGGLRLELFLVLVQV